MSAWLVRNNFRQGDAPTKLFEPLPYGRAGSVGARAGMDGVANG